MALLGAGVVALVLTEGVSSPRTQLVLIMAVAAAVCVLIGAMLAADSATRRAHDLLWAAQRGAHAGEDLARRVGELSLMVTRGRHDLMELMKRLANGEAEPRRTPDGTPGDSPDPVVRLARELNHAQTEAWNAVLDATDAAAGRGPDQRVEVFVSLARRMQSLSHRAIQGLDDLENQVEDPDLLKGLFRVDHLSTRMRRQAESLAVIGGAVSRRQWSRPVTMYEVLRSAIAEVEQYNRVKVVPPVDGTIHGSAVADIIHLLAELIENATKFAPPQTQVLLRAETVTAGLAIEVEDRGLGIPRENVHRLNDLLADFDPSGVDELLRDGRIGLVVVAALARRHNVAVQLQSNVYGGTQAVVVLPRELIGGSQDAEDEPRAQEQPVPVGAAATPAPEAAAPAAAPEPVSPAAAPAMAQAAGPATGPVTGPATGPVTSVPSLGGPYAPAREATAAAPPSEAPATHTHAGGGPSGERPPLPKRNAQASLAPELRHVTAPLEDEEPDAPHNPGLMAAFQQGMRSGRGDDFPADEAEDTPVTEHDEPRRSIH